LSPTPSRSATRPPEQDRPVVADLPEEPAAPDSADLPDAPDVPLRAYVVVVAGAVLVQMFWARTVFLFSDDYIFLTQGLHAELTWDYLKEPLFGHFSPVSRLTDLLVAPAIHDRPQIIYLVLVCAAAAVVAATAFLMTGALGRTRLALLGTALVGTSLTIVPLTNWYTAGVNILPALTGAFLCFGASVRLLRSRRWWWTVLAVLGYLLAVLSWELAAIIPLYVVVWAVLFRSRIGNPSYGAMLRRGAVAWAALVLIAVAVAVNYLGGYYAAQPSGSVWEIGAAVAVSFVQTLVPLAMGVYPASWGVLGIVVPVLTAVLLAILVRASLRRDRQAWRGWTFAVVGWLVPAVALVLSRVGIFGVSVAQQPMYFLLPVTLATLGALLAWSPAQPTHPPQPTQTRLALRRRWVAVVSVALLGVGYVLSGPAVVNTLFTYALGKYGTPHPDYVDHLLASVDRLRPGPAFSVLDGDVPGGLVPPTFSPYNRVSTVLDLYAPDVALDSPTPPWYVPDSTGELKPATVDWIGTAAFGNVATTSVFSSGVRDLTIDPRQGLCFEVETSTAVVVVPLPFPVSSQVELIRTRATADRATPGRVIFLTPRGWAAANEDPQGWPAGASTRLESAAAAGSQSVGFDSMQPGTSFCVTTMEFGSVSTPSR